jgi:hypothetical protein
MAGSRARKRRALLGSVARRTAESANRTRPAGEAAAMSLFRQAGAGGRDTRAVGLRRGWSTAVFGCFGKVVDGSGRVLSPFRPGPVLLRPRPRPRPRPLRAARGRGLVGNVGVVGSALGAPLRTSRGRARGLAGSRRRGSVDLA